MTSPKSKPSKVGPHYPERLVEKYRPRRIADFLGLAEPKLILGAFARTPRPEVFLFTGPSGLGKTTMAQALCEEVDGEFHHIASSQVTVPVLQNVLRLAQYWPALLGSQRFFLIDEADHMTDLAQVSLLSQLDSTEWTNTSIFCFTCNQTGPLETRFLSRCKVINFVPAGLDIELPPFLEKVWDEEGGIGPHPDFKGLAKECRYNVRDCLNKLEVELVRSGTAEGLGQPVQVCTTIDEQRMWAPLLLLLLSVACTGAQVVVRQQANSEVRARRGRFDGQMLKKIATGSRREKRG